MTRVGVTLDDIGETFPWTALRDFITHLPPVPECALYRAQYPKSWWWTADMDFLSAILVTGQWANWQRGGGKGEKPKPIKRPRDGVVSKKQPKTKRELQERKSKVQQEIQKRRELRHGN